MSTRFTTLCPPLFSLRPTGETEEEHLRTSKQLQSTHNHSCFSFALVTFINFTSTITPMAPLVGQQKSRPKGRNKLLHPNRKEQGKNPRCRLFIDEYLLHLNRKWQSLRSVLEGHRVTCRAQVHLRFGKQVQKRVLYWQNDPRMPASCHCYQEQRKDTVAGELGIADHTECTIHASKALTK